MREKVKPVEEIQSEHQSKAEMNMEQETENAEGEEQNIEQRTKKRQRITEPTEDYQVFISDIAHGVTPQNPGVSSTTCQPLEVYGNWVSRYRSHMSRITRLIPAY